MNRPYWLRGSSFATAITLAIATTCIDSAAAATIHSQQRQEKRMNKQSSKLKAQEISIVDENGRVCMVLSAHDGSPSIQMLGSDGTTLLSASLSKDGFGAVKIANPNKAGSVAAIEVDDKGAHVKFDRPGGASSYVFLNNAGVSGAVFIDAKGKRRLNAMVREDGSPEIQRLDESGNPLP